MEPGLTERTTDLHRLLIPSMLGCAAERDLIARWFSARPLTGNLRRKRRSGCSARCFAAARMSMHAASRAAGRASTAMRPPVRTNGFAACARSLASSAQSARIADFFR